jgi:hypothetical protein
MFPVAESEKDILNKHHFVYEHSKNIRLYLLTDDQRALYNIVNMTWCHMYRLVSGGGMKDESVVAAHHVRALWTG